MIRVYVLYRISGAQWPSGNTADCAVALLWQTICIPHSRIHKLHTHGCTYINTAYVLSSMRQCYETGFWTE